MGTLEQDKKCKLGSAGKDRDQEHPRWGLASWQAGKQRGSRLSVLQLYIFCFVEFAAE